MVIEITLPDLVVAELTKRAADWGLSRSAYVRMVVTQSLSSEVQVIKATTWKEIANADV